MFRFYVVVTRRKIPMEYVGHYCSLNPWSIKEQGMQSADRALKDGAYSHVWLLAWDEIAGFVSAADDASIDLDSMYATATNEREYYDLECQLRQAVAAWLARNVFAPPEFAPDHQKGCICNE